MRVKVTPPFPHRIDLNKVCPALRSSRFAPAFIALTLSACAEDFVGRDEVANDTCGDDVKGPTEDCDNEGPGCTECLTTPGYACDDQNRCFFPCGNGIEGDGETCESPRRTEACDVTGWWVARETDFTRDTILGGVQTSSTWFLYRFAQDGDVLRVEESLHCGIEVTGSVGVTYTPGTGRAFLYDNDMTPAGPHGPRRGVARVEGTGCRFELDRWYNVRGAEPSFLPADFRSLPPLSELTPIPLAEDPVDAPPPSVAGATDPDADGNPGAAYFISGLVSGTRNSIQRDYKEYGTPEGQWIAQGAVDFVVPGDNDLEESILSVTGCGTSCAFIASTAYVDPNRVPRLAMHYLGRDIDGPNIRSVIVGVPRADLDADVATCANVRAVLPHDPSKE
jgi:hypothetical protein